MLAPINTASSTSADATGTVCHYALVHFLPYAETGEFCNVGVVMFSPTARCSHWAG